MGHDSRARLEQAFALAEDSLKLAEECPALLVRFVDAADTGAAPSPELLTDTRALLAVQSPATLRPAVTAMRERYQQRR